MGSVTGWRNYGNVKKVVSGSRDPLEVVLGTSRRRRRQPLEEVLVDGVTQFDLEKELATSRRHHD